MQAWSIFSGSLVVWLGFAMTAQATNYYVSPQGDDRNVGSIGAPWATLLRVATGPLQPGDSVLLDRTGIWRETLTLPNSGTAAMPIVVAPFGAGLTRPEIRGSLELTSPIVSGTRTAQVAAGTQVKALLDGNTVIPVSRYPDTGWITAQAIANDTTLLLPPGPAAIDWTGASIHLRTSMWTLETHTVKSGIGGRISLSTKLISIPPTVQLYFSNHEMGLSSTHASWYQSTTSNNLVWSDPEAIHPSIDAAVRPIAINLKSRNYIQLRGLRILAATQHGLYSTGTGVEVIDCAFRMPGLVAAQLDGAHMKFRNNWIVGATNCGIIGHGSAPVVEGNNIRQIAKAELFGPDGMGDGCCGGHGIAMNGDSAKILRNDIDQTGYNGITFVGKYSEIRHNLVAHSCMTTDDCSGIYTIAGKYDNPGAMGSVIAMNLVQDAWGSPAGMPQHSSAAQGIYLDDGSHDIRVDSNVCVGNSSGLFLHNTQRVAARSNFLGSNRVAQVQLQHDAIAGAGHMMDNRFEANTLIALPTQLETKTSISQTQPMEPALWSDNTLCTDNQLLVRCRKAGVTTLEFQRLPDTSPVLSPESLPATDLSGWVVQSKPVIGLVDVGSRPTSTSLKVLDSSRIGSLLTPTRTVAISKGELWRLSFRAKGGPNQMLYPVFRRAYGDYANLGSLPITFLDTTWQSFVYLLTATQTESRARQDFHSSDSVYWIEGISLRKVSNSFLANLATTDIKVNSTSTPLTYANLSFSFDVSGTPITSLTLPSYTGGAIFQTEKPPTTPIRAIPTNAGVHIFRKASTWVIEGQHGPVLIYGLQGALEAQLVPDAKGRAIWNPRHRNGSVYWVKTKTQAIQLLSID